MRQIKLKSSIKFKSNFDENDELHVIDMKK